MFTDEFYKMTAADQNNFAEVCNKLLLKGFIVRDIFDNKEKMMRVNPDYRFLERFFEVFESYLKFSGWRIEKDNILGVIALSNDYNDNRVKVDRETSLVLFTLRLIYENQKSESNALTQSIYMTTPMLINEMNEHGVYLPNKRLSGRAIGRCLRFLAVHNIINKVSGNYDEGNVTFYILPSVVYALNNEKIIAMSSLLDEINGKEINDEIPN